MNVRMDCVSVLCMFPPSALSDYLGCCMIVGGLCKLIIGFQYVHMIDIGSRLLLHKPSIISCSRL